MKYWRGYLAAALMLALCWALTSFAAAHTTLVDMIYPYASRMIQTSLASWTAETTFCLWQLLVIFAGAALLASVVAMIVLRWNFFQWLGWVLAACSFVVLMHTGLYGLNGYSTGIAEDLRLEEADFTVTELAEATSYYLEKANELSTQVPRNSNGTPNYPTFEELADMAAEGFDTLTYDQYYAVFAGSTLPVKQLDWADTYTSMGITGVFIPITGEAAVNPQTPAVALPFVMCHEMCHRMCISIERDANMGAFLACDANSDPIFQYSAYFMAFRYCYNALKSTGTATAKSFCSQLYAEIGDELMLDLEYYDEFFASNADESATNLANTANDAYIKISGDENGTASYSKVSDLLVSWYIQQIYLPAHQEEVVVFDPMDKTQVDLSENEG